MIVAGPTREYSRCFGNRAVSVLEIAANWGELESGRYCSLNTSFHAALSPEMSVPLRVCGQIAELTA